MEKSKDVEVPSARNSILVRYLACETAESMEGRVKLYEKKRKKGLENDKSGP